MKRLEYSSLGKELKAQTDIAKKQHKKLDNTYEFDKIIKEEKPAFKKYNRSNLIYNRKFSYEYYTTIKNSNSFSVTSKYPILLSFYSDLKKFHNLTLQNEMEKTTTYHNASNYTMSVLNFFLMNTRVFRMLKKQLGNKYNPINIFIETFCYGAWFQNEESTDTTSKKSDKKDSVDLSHMPPLEGDKLKEGKRLEILTPNKLLI